MSTFAMKRSLLGLVVVLGSVLTLAPTSLGSPHSHSRDLLICVDSHGTSADLPMIRSRLERIITQRVEVHPNFAAAGYVPARSSVTEGCPSSPALLMSGERHPKNGGAPGLAGFTASPSGVRAFVFVVPAREIDRMFGTLTYTTAFQEITCTTDDHCGEESTAFYVTSELFDVDPVAADARLAKGLLEAIGLELPFQIPTRVAPQTPRTK